MTRLSKLKLSELHRWLLQGFWFSAIFVFLVRACVCVCVRVCVCVCVSSFNVSSLGIAEFRDFWSGVLQGC